ncbi:[FeFe] hydrogenase H-cluster maturation GTPase HydF [Anaerococcus degeneri]|uniref:[FeFe] hydrogenase H-cluster maturation GTPase HydF n=1 Tax=Anaerococcus degeneri TaxID=361500 RepID=A0ABS7YW02_9FIRM|nr:[FeFe] hydrogenase H-cluster maturation GTPase HydF [Anaerococcus degeneri]MBP2015556.1 [FeFe] hydrogenase H-cluster maturation GTPase HydF [Anaerococcus degeneri]MCA2095912.1 [FeFe] hydrogenase H-cluster maturation GTPase HydF [Anaerococcus degeneri]
MTSISKTGHSERVHIGIFGKTNSGKSTLLNYLTSQDVAIVSPIEGTTTDPIRKAMEITDFGPVVFIDTAGTADETQLGKERYQKTLAEIDKVDIFLYVLSPEDDLEIITEFKNKPVIFLAMKMDTCEGNQILNDFANKNPIGVDLSSTKSRDEIFSKIKALYKKEDLSITKNLVKKGDMVVLVMPQDAAAPKDRIIKPQVMTIREIIDKGASAICTDLRNFETTIKSLNKIDLIITDSQAFKEVYEKKPNEVKLTSFSVLFSAFKGDLEYFVKSANVLDEDIKNILIAEACSHPPIDEDIGSVKIPRLIKKTHPDINIDFVRGNDPIAYEKYDLIIACGSCMFNRTHVLNRVAKAKEAGTPMTNYGIAIAKMNKILEKISLPE